MTRLTNEEVDEARRFAESYTRRLDPDRRVLLERYEFVDAARKVVGVGSVGTRCYTVLLAATVDLDPLFLQIKEAQPSVVGTFVGRSPYKYPSQGQRVAVGQRVMQAASDVFLGWARASGFDGYVRQLRDMKFSVGKLDQSQPDGLVGYGRLCGATLAEPTPAPASRPSWPATWAADRHSTRPCPTSRSPTPTRTSATTRRSGGPSSRAGSPPSSAADHAHRGESHEEPDRVQDLR